MLTTQSTTANKPVKEIISLLGRYNLIPQLQREMIIDEAISAVECTPQEQENAYQRFLDRNPNINGNIQEKARQQLLETLTRQLKIEKFKRATWEKELPTAFMNRKSQLDQLVYSRIVNQDRGIAQELYFRLVEEEETWADLVHQYSQDQKAIANGIVGPVAVCSLAPQIAQKLLGSKPGQVIPPICIQNAFHVVRLEKVIPAVLDDSMRCLLYHELFESWLAQQCKDSQSQQLIWEKLNSLTA